MGAFLIHHASSFLNDLSAKKKLHLRRCDITRLVKRMSLFAHHGFPVICFFLLFTVSLSFSLFKVGFFEGVLTSHHAIE
ncbi:hypothetical protein BDF20DRAFT_992070 [Mycotypha africana]|uniref:uncharacterized protein n=1 Tax=Mycotypha africana TaxID=64632 RepID=UPI0023007ED5|nr:uncharacterized protein BDF20DRAFT_992070 [Mycotypha africana]KAI8967245.1 hypothetical protein BDF20DRAFT_992070 [Mycotypha africana]